MDESGGEAPQPRYRPPETFLAKDVAQITAFLIRNRGRIDTQAVRAKWDILDRFSLPLAVHLREIEATGAWDNLEKEIGAAPLRPGKPEQPGIPKSIRHQKILTLLPDWSKRGEDILSGWETDDPAPAPDTGPVPPDTDPPKP